MDRGISATWYDLPEKGRDEYLAWLHGTYLPRLLKEPGILWAAHYKSDEGEIPLPRLRHTTDKSIPTGWRYIVLVGGEDAHVFSPLSSFNQKGKVDPADQKMLDMRIGTRMNLFTEEDRVDGPDAGKREGKYTLAPCIQFGSFNSGAYTDEDELLAWYADYRLPTMATMPSSIGMRKLVSVSGWAKHGVIYEFTSVEGRAKNFRAREHEGKFSNLKEWTEQVVSKLVHAPGSPNVCERLWPPIKA